MKPTKSELLSMAAIPYDADKINADFTNTDYARQWFPRCVCNDEQYDLGNGYRINWVESETFTVDHLWFDRDVGHVTDTDLFTGNFGQCIAFIVGREGMNS